MKSSLKLIAAAALVCLCAASCKKEESPSAKCYFALATDLSPLGEKLVCTSDYDHFFVAMDDKTLLPVDNQRRYITIEMIGDAAENFVWAGLSASSYGHEGSCYAFKTKVSPAPLGLAGSAKIVYDDGTLHFEKTVELVTPELSDFSKGCEAVDLGLSVKWASYNVGAAKPEDAGHYFAWGETSGKENYGWAKEGDYKWGVYDSKALPKYGMTKYTAGVNGGDGHSTLDPADDAATKNWGTKWRTPTSDEIMELLDNTNCEWKWVLDKKGYTVKSLKTGNSIFLPAAGHYDGTNLTGVGESGNYWSSTVHTTNPRFAFYIDFTLSQHSSGLHSRYAGLSVRAVTEH